MTLQGHSNYVWRVEQLESGDLVSCSNDSTIKVWNLAEGTCIRTLVGHNGSVRSIRSIRLNSQNNALVSCSWDGTIKTWDSKTGECVNTINVKNDARLHDLILI